MNLLQTIIFIPFFVFAACLAFYIPGKVILGKMDKSQGVIPFTCAIVIGIVLWGWQGFLFGYLHLRFLSYAYLFVFFILFIKRKLYMPNLKRPKNIDLLSVALVTIGTLGQTIIYLPSGFVTSEGIALAKYNRPDHIWHTSLINEMVKRFPPQEPGMYGVLLSNYHYWFNLVTAELIRVFHLPLFQTQYIGMYILGSLLLGLTAYTFSTAILKSKSFVRWLLFFLYFGADASFILSYITSHTFNFVIPSVIENATIFIDNPPRAYSILILFIALYFLFTKVRSNEKKYFFIIVVLVGSLIGFKVYTGMTMLVGLFALALYDIYKRNWRTFLIFLSSFVLSAIIFIPVNAHSGGIFFNPFDRQRDFITYKPLGLNDMELRWIVYVMHKSYLRLLEYGFIMTGIYFFAQYGIRLIGFIPYKKTFFLLGKEKSVVIYTAMIFPILFVLVFSQKAHASDSFNFFLSGLFFLTILTSLHLSLFLQKKSKVIIISVVLLIAGIMLPRWIYEESTNFHLSYISHSFYGITYAELASYTFLRDKTSPNSMVLVINTGHLDQFSAVVSIFSDRHMYLSGLGVIRAHDAENKERTHVVEDIEQSKDSSHVLQILHMAHITHVYIYNDSKFRHNLEKTLLHHKVFYNTVATIYKT